MRPALPEEAVEFGLAVEGALAGRLGGTDAARRAEADASVRTMEIAPLLEELGAGDLDPTDGTDAAAAAELCRMAGRVVLPYPVVPLLLRSADPDGAGRPVGLVADGAPWRVDHADLVPDWVIVTPQGHSAGASGGHGAGRLGTRLGPFVGDLRPAEPGAIVAAPPSSAAARAACLHLALTGWTVLGTLERALELAVDHVSARVQFGQTLSGFQAVQFQLADAAVGVDGLRELCRFTLWRLLSDPERSLPDALALRLHALDVARAVLRTTQQLHGAAGFCDEYDISILCRHCQPALRLPFGAERTSQELYAAIAELGFDGLFPHGRDAVAP